MNGIEPSSSGLGFPIKVIWTSDVYLSDLSAGRGRLVRHGGLIVIAVAVIVPFLDRRRQREKLVLLLDMCSIKSRLLSVHSTVG